MKKLRIFICFCLICLIALIASCASRNVNLSTDKITRDNASVMIEMEKGGRIIIEFYPQDAPNTVDNFIKLAQKGYYNGVTFHRVEPGLLIQGGDPSGDGTGGPGYSIKAEFNSRKHVEGTVAMARKPDNVDSAGSQFYICLKPLPTLDGNYTVFGQVVEGMDVAKDIQKGDVMKKVTIIDKSTLK
jgi:cyclophilin family peptidyl-prolyl cis-trans isomerase